MKKSSDNIIWLLVACLLLPGFGASVSTFFGGVMLAFLFAAVIFGIGAAIVTLLDWVFNWDISLPDVNVEKYSKAIVGFSVVLFVGVHLTSLLCFGTLFVH